MKTKLFLTALILGLGLSSSSVATTITNRPTPAKHGCQEINVHCKCTHPDRDFKVENQKLGKINPGDPGECKSSKEINAQAEKMPVAYCLTGGEYSKDSRKGISKCTATWTCAKPCTIPSAQ